MYQGSGRSCLEHGFSSATVILPAAGVSLRFQGPTIKQYIEILGRPLMSYTIEAFEKMTWIEEILLVVSGDKVEFVSVMLDKFHQESRSKIKVLTGGSSRHRSIYAALEFLRDSKQLKEGNFLVIVHDVVRPYINENDVLFLCRLAAKHKAAGTTRPLVSTVLQTGSNGSYVGSLSRDETVASETPQAFALQTLLAAYDAATAEELNSGTECLKLVESHVGVEPKLFPVYEDCYWKVTYSKDFDVASVMVKGRNLNNVSYFVCRDSNTDVVRSNSMCLLVQRVNKLLRGIERSESSSEAIKQVFKTGSAMSTFLVEIASADKLDRFIDQFLLSNISSTHLKTEEKWSASVLILILHGFLPANPDNLQSLAKWLAGSRSFFACLVLPLNIPVEHEDSFVERTADRIRDVIRSRCLDSSGSLMLMSPSSY